MGVYIDGLDMPKNGESHHITIYDNGNTYITTSNMLCETDRKDVEATELDLVRCGECKYQYMCGHQIKRNGLTLKLTYCEYGEGRADD